MKTLQDIANLPPWLIRKELQEYIDRQNKRTSAQHRSLFLWFSMIEHEAENAGITYDMVIQHTSQLRVTKENLHELCKQLMAALWGTTSTKELKKNKQLDIIIDHFTDLFGKVGLELPPFPSNEE